MTTASILTRQIATRLPVEKISLPESMAQILPRAPQMTNTERAVQCIMVLAYNFGVNVAFDHYTRYYEGRQGGISISWLIESRAFPGTLYADLFDLMCGEA